MSRAISGSTRKRCGPGWARLARCGRRHADGAVERQREELKRLRGEVRELRQANEILKAASVFFAKKLHGIPPPSCCLKLRGKCGVQTQTLPCHCNRCYVRPWRRVLRLPAAHEARRFHVYADTRSDWRGRRVESRDGWNIRGRLGQREYGRFGPLVLQVARALVTAVCIASRCEGECGGWVSATPTASGGRYVLLSGGRDGRRGRRFRRPAAARGAGDASRPGVSSCNPDAHDRRGSRADSCNGNEYREAPCV